MKKSLIFCLLLFVIFTVGCLIEDDKDDGAGVISVTVNTSANIWGYPTSTLAYAGASNAKFGYPYVGGNTTVASLPGNGSNQYYYYPNSIVDAGVDLAATKTAYSNVGTLKNYVYIFSSISQRADNNPVLYKGESSTNGDVITIAVKPGTYYVVAFYDYRTGGNVENILNRYDRYAIYANASDAVTGNSTPYFDKAATITVGEDQIVEITLDINDKNWVMGKPKATDTSVSPNVEYEMGRYFLRTGDYAPVP